MLGVLFLFNNENKPTLAKINPFCDFTPNSLINTDTKSKLPVNRNNSNNLNTPVSSKYCQKSMTNPPISFSLVENEISMILGIDIESFSDI